MDPLVTAFEDDQLKLIDVRSACAAPFPNPFDQRRPSGLALAAGGSLLTQFRNGRISNDIESKILETPGSGKMFGVLVVETPEGELGFLRAFSGMLNGRWEVAGFAPPLFDCARRSQIEIVGEADVKALAVRAETIADSEELAQARRAVEELENRLACEREALRLHHIENRRQRHMQRRARSSTQIDSSSTAAQSDFLEELARRSRADKTERRRLDERHEHERGDVVFRLRKYERELAALNRLRSFVSRRVIRQIHDTYCISNARGEQCAIRELFEIQDPPPGAGDCAAAKLIAYAHAHSLRPIAFAQFWFGAPPAAGGRLSSVYYPACRSKCARLLPYMLEGLDVSSLAAYSPPDTKHLDIRIIFEDDRIVVIDKPPGLLSVPSSNQAIVDSATVRLRSRMPSVAGPLFVHRLDMDTSGLRTIEKRYVAWVDGDIAANEGIIDLAVRGDLGDRPRHIYDPIDGKAAVTLWRVLERKNGCTRLELRPVTGRTHQLRIHAAHPLGLDAPIIGDNLYGRGGERLMLHAEMLRLRHPATNEFITIESSAPF
jgi:tRNA pseudouridine32 synthase/23S rRNA pseudouridine746 synthase